MALVLTDGKSEAMTMDSPPYAATAELDRSEDMRVISALDV